MSESKTSTACIELICQQGCSVVREIIIKLEQHEPVRELQHLSELDLIKVLAELKAVMSVYDQQI